MKKMDAKRKFLALFLIFAMLFGDSSMSAFADVIGSVKQKTETAEEPETVEENTAEPESVTESETETETETEPESGSAEGSETETESGEESTAMFTYSDSLVSLTAEASEDAGIPQGAELRADVLSVTSYEYEDAVDAIEEQLAEALGLSDSETVAADYFFYDIYFLYEDDRIEPAAGSVKVEMTFSEPQVSSLTADYESAEFVKAEVVHLTDGGEAGIVTDYVNTGDNGAVTSMGFTLSSFSVVGAAVVYDLSGDGAGAELADDDGTGGYLQPLT